MKKLILIVLGLVPAMCWAQENHFILDGKVGNDSSPVKAYLIYNSSGKRITDSSLVNKGVFQFKGTLDEPVEAEIILDHKEVDLAKIGTQDVLKLYLAKGNINITGNDSVKTAIVTGSTSNDEERKYNTIIAGPTATLTALDKEYYAATSEQKKDSQFITSLQARFAKASEEKRILLKQFIETNPHSFISLDKLEDFAGDIVDAPVIQPLYDSLAADIQNTPSGREFKKVIATANATSIGAMAPVFTQNDINGKPVSLTDFKGKYVLVDFWASWCPPCRAENPNVVKAYNRYKTKNFTILGVSLDRPGKKNDWMSAIKADSLEWTQVSDLEFWQNAVVLQYGIKSVPQNFLIDPNGKIIAKNLRGEELNKKLAELFD